MLATFTRVHAAVNRPLRNSLLNNRSFKPRNFAMAIAENYDEVLKGKYPAKDHARKVAKWIVEKGGDKKGTIYLEAQKQKLNEVRGFGALNELC
jgi:hypothetical protein